MCSMVEKVSMNNTVKKGDLVEFYSTVTSFMKDYEDRNPGIVLSVMDVKKSVDGKWPARKSAEVMWKDNTVTSEHSTYLRRITK